ncbi:MAG TPA: hypothetical protein VNZ58_01115 [Thermomicrobiales bacterium]|nr:hypothetical protein [Thermomicrobiales bacterium]
MPSSDHPTTPMPTGLPEPPSGVGAADLATDSTDPGELRTLLERARERLAFYESFDRIIGENIRRSGELMVETVSLREQAQALAEQSAKDRAAFEATRQADRDHYRAIVQTALDEAASIQPVIDAMVGKLQDVLTRIDNPVAEPVTNAISSISAPSESPAEVEEPTLTEPDASEPVASAPEPSPEIPEPIQTEPEPESVSAEIPAIEEPKASAPRTIQILAHQVPNAKTAIALQKMLRGIDIVTSVDAREFANGELRLAVTATGPLPEDTLTAWLTDNAGELTSSTETVVEVTFND